MCCVCSTHCKEELLSYPRAKDAKLNDVKILSCIYQLILITQFSRVLPPWSNLWLLGSIAVSMILHMLILYVPALALMFSVRVLDPTLVHFCQ